MSFCPRNEVCRFGNISCENAFGTAMHKTKANTFVRIISLFLTKPQTLGTYVHVNICIFVQRTIDISLLRLL